eukprot:CAMPEP_0177754082 /NCGR_PEP_ID=MMETSP0491_2-20121128/1816_1 /TAXON_ID=63592 /ORGANISM="Tetraselmis chuii, Strain PLY429" /LENGTH=173 /DNA_ID=CAMNT_0019269435 /DNA_START=371 /DNA_END=893 /DNA_ORIENTATION=-
MADLIRHKKFLPISERNGQDAAERGQSSGLRDNLLGAGSDEPPIITERPPAEAEGGNGFLRGCKTAAWTFVLYAIIGAVVAILIKSMTVVLAITVIVLFILIQILTASGMVAVNWSQVGAKLMSSVDRDGDGRFGWGDAKAWVWDFVTFVTSRGIPACAGLAVGAYLGFRFTS